MTIRLWMKAAVLFLLVLPSVAFSYVFLAPQRPRLYPADGRTQEFFLTSQAPVFLDKGTFENGTYSGYSDDEVFALLVQRSMHYWNEIPNLSIQLKVASTRQGVIDSDDNLFSIGIAKISTVASGLAYPVADENDLSRLRDCDIQVGSDIDSIPSFIFVMIHELGHCLGLGHNHSDPSAIMGYWQPRSEVVLGLDDMAGVLSLYPPVAGERPTSFAPCGSLASLPWARRNSDDAIFIEDNSSGDLERRRIAWIARFLLMLIPAGGLLRFGLTSWSCRHRQRPSGL